MLLLVLKKAIANSCVNGTREVKLYHQDEQVKSCTRWSLSQLYCAYNHNLANYSNSNISEIKTERLGGRLGGLVWSTCAHSSVLVIGRDLYALLRASEIL